MVQQLREAATAVKAMAAVVLKDCHCGTIFAADIIEAVATCCSLLIDTRQSAFQEYHSAIERGCHSTLQLLSGGMAAGEGEFGIVHKAAFHGTLVAAKILKGSSAIALGDFRSEIEVLRKVHHPNAVQFLGACTKQEPYILVTGAERHFCTRAED